MDESGECARGRRVSVGAREARAAGRTRANQKKLTTQRRNFRVCACVCVNVCVCDGDGQKGKEGGRERGEMR